MTGRVASLRSKVFMSAADDIIAAGRFLAARGWAPATAGNYSALLPDGRILITVSGEDKGALTHDSLMRIDADGTPIDNRHPSAETRLHVSLYQTYSSCRAVLHTHSVASTVLTRRFPEMKTLILTGYELLKIFPGITTHDTSVAIPIVDNSQDMDILQNEIQPHLRPDLSVYLIRGHGLYGWAKNVATARAVIEATEFMLECELEMRR